MHQLIARLRDEIIKASGNPSFIHHRWYVKYHLEIVEKIAEELCELHPRAHRDTVLALVWIHDYGKMISFTNQHALTLSEGRKLLVDIGFSPDFTTQLLEFAEMLDKSWDLDLSTAPIEVRIVSSADGCSHLVGPFFHMWWRENADKPFEQLMADNQRKLFKDWNRKIVLPEARKAFEPRYKVISEQIGTLPQSFISTPVA